jgi:sensor histidine kinase YesM
MPFEPRAEDIARIERELEILRSRYALMEYWSGVLRVFFKLLLPILAIVAIVIAYIVITLVDVVFGLFTISLFVIIGVLGWLVQSRNSSSHSMRWIDLASPLPRFNRWLYPNSRSEAEQIEEQIATREKRLAQLNGASS